MKKNNTNIISSKLILCHQESLTKLSLVLNDSDQIKNLLSEMLEINLIKEKKDFELLFYCNNIKKIESILYEENEIIFLNNKLIKNELTDYFHICLLIGNNITFINYTFNIDLIRDIEKLLKEINNKIYKKVIMSKIVIEFIENYKETDYYKKNDDKELKQIESENNKIIEDNISIFKELGLY